MRRALFALLLVVVAACGGGESANVMAMVASHPSAIGVGEQRVLVALIDTNTDQTVAAEDLEVVGTLRDRIGTPLGESDGELVWVVPDARGIYAFNFEIPGPGTFQITIDAGRYGELAPIGIVTSEDPPGLGVGDQAPLSVTRTTPEYELDDITSDPRPDPAFYEMTVAEAVTSGPSVLVFGTPAWCTSQACGPMLEQVKAIAPQFSSLNFVHIEIYDNIHVTSRDDLILVPAVEEWQLVAEPWIYITDDSGRISHSFEGAVSDAELLTALTEAAA